MYNSRQLDFTNNCISVNHPAPCLLHVPLPSPRFPTKATLLIGAIATLCLSGLALAVDFPEGIEKSFCTSALSWRGTLTIHSAGHGRSTHLQSRRQPKRGANARFQQTEPRICHGSAHGDSFDLDPSKPQPSTKVEWIPAFEKLWWKFPWLSIPSPGPFCSFRFTSYIQP